MYNAIIVYKSCREDVVRVPSISNVSKQLASSFILDHRFVLERRRVARTDDNLNANKAQQLRGYLTPST